MELLIATGPWEKVTDDLLVIPATSGKLAGVWHALDRAFGGDLARLWGSDGFEAKEGEWAVAATLGRLPSRRVGVYGMGGKGRSTPDAWRRMGAMLVRRARDLKAKTVAFVWDESLVPAKGADEVMAAFCEGILLGAYRFHRYKEKESREAKEKDIHRVQLLVTQRASASALEKARLRASTVAEAVCLARDLVNTPSHDMTPAHLAEVARSLVKKGNGVRVQEMDAKEMEALGMHAALAVGRGSMHAPVGIHLSYVPPKPKKRVAIVGKAVTFDSGGLSLKPADGMMTMKIDMAGAAAVLGLFKALPAWRPNVEVHGIFLAVENMPSGSAYRPGDVVRAKNGVAIEVLNTDAEGRITLADALSYAVDLQPDAIVDLATLTGACVVALGEDMAALLTNNRRLSERLRASAAKAGEDVWELPLFAPYQDLIKSKVGDIKNIGGRAAGTITAGLFLQHFVGETPWAHLDIAGPAYAEKESRPEIPFGGTGFGVRTLLAWLEGGV